MLTTFIVTITNHSRITIHLRTTIRSNVTAKDVLPSVHAMIARDSPMLHKSATWIRLSGFFWTISRCCPNPRFAATWETAAYAIRQHYQRIEVSQMIQVSHENKGVSYNCRDCNAVVPAKRSPHVYSHIQAQENEGQRNHRHRPHHTFHRRSLALWRERCTPTRRHSEHSPMLRRPHSGVYPSV